MDLSSELFSQALKAFPGGVNSPVRSFKGLHTTPRFVDKAYGYKIIDVDNKDYIDFCMSFGPMILGHQHPTVKEAIIHALDDGWSYGACEKHSLELAHFIKSKISFIEQLRFVNSGTEAVMTAVRLARGYTQRSKILKFNGCYHGHLDSLLVQSGSGLAGTLEASSKGVTQETIKNTPVAELDDIRSVEAIFQQYSNDIAAIIMEPLPANYGLLPQRLEFLKQIRELCNKHQALLIFDEVISGFRVSFGGMSETTGITPDLVTYGKIIGGGMPVGAIAGPKKIMELLAPVGDVYQAGTLSANPVAMRAGLATLKLVSEPGFYQNLNKVTQDIVSTFSHWCKSFESGRFNYYHFEQYSSLFWPIRKSPRDIEPLRNIKKLPISLKEDFYGFFKVLLNKGIYLAPNAYEVGFVSLAHMDSIQDLEDRLFKKS
jgi:glutamate-1-semialdehyde 2,1-aminomutase